MALSKGGFSETACAILALTTKLSWTQEMPQPLPRSVVRRMLDCGALKGLVLRDLPDIEEKWLERARLLLGRVSDVAEKMADYRAAGYELLLQGDERWLTALCKLAENDKKICAITAAMTLGTGLSQFSKKYKDRFFDVGIAEEHAVTFACGLATKGIIPVFAVYSTFLQRSFDQMLHDAHGHKRQKRRLPAWDRPVPEEWRHAHQKVHSG